MFFAPQWRALFRHLNLQKWSEHGVSCTFGLGNVLRAAMAYTFSTYERQKVVREWCVLYILTWKCASRHNCVPFFDISTSRSGPNMVCLVHLDLEMCFAPQWHTLFRHLNCQKWSDQFLTLLTWKCASRHNGVQLFISHLARSLHTRSFSKPTFRSSRATDHWKNIVNRDFPTFSPTCIFFLLWSSHFFSSSLWLFPPLLFQLSILSEVSRLNFLRLLVPVQYMCICKTWLLRSY